ncbi:DUF362 domain-containing protein [Candidatus Latescibacterota bacterium]
MQRRDFMKKTGVAGALYAGTELFGYAMPRVAEAFGTGGGIDVAEGTWILEQGKAKNVIPEIRPEILNNPRAVFLIETHVDSPRDERGFFSDAQPQLEETGKKVAKQIFVKGTTKGGSTIVRPNFTTVPNDVLSPVCGINTSCDFIAGFIQSMRELDNTNIITSARGTSVVTHRKTGIYDVFDKHRINLIEANYRRFSHYDKKDLNWHKVVGAKPMVWKNIPTYRPIGDKDNLFINMPTLKNHNLGLTTLAIKNLQGVTPTGYGHYCNRWSAMELLAKNSYNINFKRDFVKDYYQNVEAAFLKHRAAGFKHWDIENSYPDYEKKGGWDAFKKVKNNSENLKEFMKGINGALMWDEQWCQRAIDAAFAIKPDINIIEGVIGRDGSGFNVGRDELCNVLVVGIGILEVDSVGSYIMGHDPNELPYTRIGKERGLGECDPAKIDLYWIRDNEIVPIKNLSEIKRYRLGANMHTWAETGERKFW